MPIVFPSLTLGGGSSMHGSSLLVGYVKRMGSKTDVKWMGTCFSGW